MECQISLAAKRRQKPDFSVKDMLSAIAYNGHRLPCPEYLDGQMPAAAQPLHPGKRCTTSVAKLLCLSGGTAHVRSPRRLLAQ